MSETWEYTELGKGYYIACMGVRLTPNNQDLASKEEAEKVLLKMFEDQKDADPEEFTIAKS